MSTTKKTAKTTKAKTKSKKSGKKQKITLPFILLIILAVLVLAVGWKMGYVSVNLETGTPEIAIHIPGFEDESAGANAGATGVSAAETVSPVASTSSSTESASKSSKPLDESAVPADAENAALYFGNPSGAVKDVNHPENYLIVHPQYTMSYNAEKYIPNWVCWHLELSDTGDADRSDDFRPDEDIPGQWYAVKKADYQYTKYGFDRGHVCPSADRTSSAENNSMTFLMSNMIPQSPDCNRVVWKDFEAYERNLAKESGKEVYIVAGPDGVGGTSGTGTWESIEMLTSGKPNGKKITVPAYCWKIALILDEGDGDISRVTKDTPVIALYMPNAMGIGKNGSWEQYLVSVDYIEDKTGYDFLSSIPDSIENVIESRVYSK